MNYNLFKYFFNHKSRIFCFICCTVWLSCPAKALREWLLKWKLIGHTFSRPYSYMARECKFWTESTQWACLFKWKSRRNELNLWRKPGQLNFGLKTSRRFRDYKRNIVLLEINNTSYLWTDLEKTILVRNHMNRAEVNASKVQRAVLKYRVYLYVFSVIAEKHNCFKTSYSELLLNDNARNATIWISWKRHWSFY